MHQSSKSIALRCHDPKHSVFLTHITKIVLGPCDGIIDFYIYYAHPTGIYSLYYNADDIAEIIQDDTNTLQMFLNYHIITTKKCNPCDREVHPDEKYCRVCGKEVDTINTIQYCPKETDLYSHLTHTHANLDGWNIPTPYAIQDVMDSCKKGSDSHSHLSTKPQTKITPNMIGKDTYKCAYCQYCSTNNPEGLNCEAFRKTLSLSGHCWNYSQFQLDTTKFYLVD